MEIRPLGRIGSSLIGAWLALFAQPLSAGTSILIWPLDPVIEAGQRSGTIWLENVGHEPVTLQIRVLAWDQRDYRDEHTGQEAIVGTPPFAHIAPGVKQLVRLSLLQEPPPGHEQAFRVLIDEIPTPREEATGTAPTAGLRFQMRYSVPLFVYGNGLHGPKSRSAQRPGMRRAEPDLSWSIEEEGGQRFLQVRNTGLGHARLSQVKLLESTAASSEGAGQETVVAAGLLGYVLPGRTMRWSLPEGAIEHPQGLRAQLSGTDTPIVLPRRNQ